MLKLRNFFFSGISREIPLSEFCGNSIVVNCLAYIMQNIAEHMKNREGD